MGKKIWPRDVQNYRRLRQEWLGFVLASSLYLLACFIILFHSQGDIFAWRWFCLAAPISIYQFYFLFTHLGDNRLKTGDSELLPNLGLANWITSSRAILNAVLAGFLLNPWPQGWASWAPGFIYLFSVILDFADGFVARISGLSTFLGETLDMQWDSFGVLIAAILSVVYGQTPWFAIMVGLARYLFVFGQWFRIRRGLPVYDLPPSNIRRPFAGTQMVFLAVILMPLFSPPVAQAAAWLLMIPFLANFFRDWIAVSTPPQEQIHEPKKSGLSILFHTVWTVLPLATRSLLIFLLFESLLEMAKMTPIPVGAFLLTVLAVMAIALGAAGRLFSLVIVIMAGLTLQNIPWDGLSWALLLIGLVSMLVGTGRFSLWKPEDGLLFKHAGRQRPAVRLQR